MKLEDLYEKLFDFEFCEPGDKALKEQRAFRWGRSHTHLGRENKGQINYK